MEVVDVLLKSDEPAIRWKVRTQVLDEPPDAPAIRRLQAEIRRSPRIRSLLDRESPPRAYAKWQGAHWVLATLADLGYPPGDDALLPLRDKVIRTWLPRESGRDLSLVNGRYRRCGSQQGNALLSVTRLGLVDDRAGELVGRLLRWQWPDGGWNCDRDPAAHISSFHETLLPMRGLAAYAKACGDARAAQAASRAAEVFLQRRLAFRRSTGELIHSDFARLHYPHYWHYDVLAGLTGMAELGLAHDDRCTDALDLLEAKRLPDGGWPAERRHYHRVSAETGPRHESVDWGGTSTKRMNEWVTAEALAVLHAAGRV